MSLLPRARGTMKVPPLITVPGGGSLDRRDVANGAAYLSEELLTGLRAGGGGPHFIAWRGLGSPHEGGQLVDALFPDWFVRAVPRIGYGVASGYDVRDWYNTIRDSQIDEPVGNAEAIADQVGRERSKPDVRAGSRRRRDHHL